jgi:pimeloyl-ACP methyl ester carboxylesterase
MRTTKRTLIGLFLALAMSGLAAAQALENGSFTAEVAGHTMHYEVHGSGPVLMTLPNSWGLSLEGLRGLYRPLEERFTIVYFDTRGMGSSRPLGREDDMSMAAVREDFDALRVKLGLNKVAAIGWSNGAINLVLLASERPEILSSAIFVHGAARLSEEDDKAMAKSRPGEYRRYGDFFQKMEKARLYPESAGLKVHDFYVNEAFPAMCADPKATAPKLKEAFKIAEFSWAHARYSNRELGAFDFRDRLPKVTARCLVVAGAHDLLPAERSREIADGVPGSEFRLFEKSGHFAMLEEPEAFQKVVESFMAHDGDEAAHVVEIERWALDRWGNGDPSGFLKVYDADVTYFDNMNERRIDGLPAMTSYYEGVKGKVHVDEYELVDPKVQFAGDAAVLTYNYAARSGDKKALWNCTEVYVRTPAGWRILQAHWSPAKAK